MATGKMRKESDLIGTRELPIDALYGVQSLRGFEIYKTSGIKMNQYHNFIKGFAITKQGAAMANFKQGKLTQEQYDAIMQACNEMKDGKLDENFCSDMIQGGAGTTMNMNANEVIANRALQIMGHKPGEYQFCSPNDHINASQSTNDAYPTAFHFGLYLESLKIIKALDNITESLEKKSEEFAKILKMGRTQLQDAVPMTLGQTFGAFAHAMEKENNELQRIRMGLLRVNMGATAIGTGICSEPGYAKLCIEALREITGWDIKLDKDLIEATSDTGILVAYSSTLKQLALKVIKMCNDLRRMGSGPRCGLEEIHLPEMTPGSSIMPGKVNPVIPEVMEQICYKVIGNDTCIMLGSENAQFELNVFEPVMVSCLFEDINLMTNGLNALRTMCIDGITANVEQCIMNVKQSIGTVTALNPFIGYKNSTLIAKIAMKTGKGVYEIVLDNKIFTKKDLDTIFAPENMVKPVNLDIKPNPNSTQILTDLLASLK